MRIRGRKDTPGVRWRWAWLIGLLGCGGSDPPPPQPIHYSTPVCPDGRMWQGKPCPMPGQPALPLAPAPAGSALDDGPPPRPPGYVAPAVGAFPIPIGQPSSVPTEPPAGKPVADVRAVTVGEPTRQACSRGDVGACQQVDCGSGQPRACYLLGLRLTQNGTPWEGLEWLERGCDLGDASACRQLGTIHAGGGTQQVDHQRRWPPTDPARALERFRRACSLGHQPSCSAEAARFGTGDRQQALMRDQHVEMCEAGPPAAMFGPGEKREPLGSSCRIAAWFYETGRGGTTDRVRACALNRRGCALHDPGACEAAAACGSRATSLPR